MSGTIHFRNATHTALIAALSGLLFTACGDDSSSNSSDEIETLKSIEEAGECTAEKEGQLYKVPRDTIFDTYECEDGEWVSDFGGSGDPVDPSTVVRDSLKDERDGKVYKTVKIGTLTWMAENLNYELDDSRCYDDNPDMCKKYGRLYRYKSNDKACPTGWKTPTKKEWNKLLASIVDESYPEMDNDPYGFNVLLGGGAIGVKNIEFEEEGEYVAYWMYQNGIWDVFKIWRLYQLRAHTAKNATTRWAYIRCVKEKT